MPSCRPLRLSRRSLLTASLAAVAGGCRSTRAALGYAFVANEEGHTVAVVGLDPFRVVRHIPLAAAPTALIAHPEKPFIYVLTPADGLIAEIGIERLGVTRKAQMPTQVIGMRMRPDDESALWVLSANGKRLVPVRLDSFRPERGFPLPAEAAGFDLARYKPFAGFTYASAGTVQMLNLQTGKFGPSVRIGEEVGAALFRSDGMALVVANLSRRMLSLISAPDGRVIANLPLAVRPDHLCVNRDGGQVFVTGQGMDAVVVVYPHHVAQVAETALAGRAPGSMAVSANYLFITSPSTGELIVMDIEKRRVIAVTAVGAEPNFIAVTPNDAYALVLNRKSGDMAVIRIGAITPNRQKSMSLLTMIPVGSRPVAAVVASV